MVKKVIAWFKSRKTEDHTTNDDLKTLIKDIDKRLTMVENTLKELVGKTAKS